MADVITSQISVSGNRYFAEEKNCEIYFSRQGEYFLSKIFMDDEFISGLPISYGKYHYDNNKIILIDAVNQYSMSLLYSPNNILQMQFSFYFLEGTTFVFREQKHDNEYIKQNNFSLAFINQERSIYSFFNKEGIPLKLGNYSEGSHSSGFMLTILQDSTYEYEYIHEYLYPFYTAFTISKGTWNRHVNKLILYDTSLKHEFYALIDKDKIISNLLPCDYQCIILYYQKDDSKVIRIPYKLGNVPF